MFINDLTWQKENPQKCADHWSCSLEQAKLKLGLIKEIKEASVKIKKDIQDIKEIKPNKDIKNLFSLNRNIFNSSVFGDDFTFRLYVYCIGKANFKDGIFTLNNQNIEVKRGQFITSYYNLMQELNKRASFSKRKTQKQVRCRIHALVRANKLEHKGYNRYSLITVINYNNKQSQNKGYGIDEGIATGKKRANRGQQYNNYNNYNNKKENYKRKKKLIFDFLPEYLKKHFFEKPDFLVYKFTSPSNFERILAYFYTFEGYNFGSKWEFLEQIKGDLRNFRGKLEIIGNYQDIEILQALSKLKADNKLTLANCADKLSKKQTKPQGNYTQELADKMKL